jgi:NAD(P)-dependent dehydrogenase (short-subunit alcohol dehydrogenase family)
MTIEGKTVPVTGANRGIGQALVAEALSRGAKRVYAGTRQPLAHPDPRVTPLTLDVTSAEQIRAAAGQVDSLDILINNAGLAPYDDLSDRAVLEQTFAVNLFGTYGVTQAFLPLLTRSRGVIVNNVSTTALAPLHRHDPGLRHAPGLRGDGRAGHLRRRGQRGGGHLPRSRVAIPGRQLAHRRGQGARAPECGPSGRARCSISTETGDCRAHVGVLEPYDRRWPCRPMAVETEALN